MKYFLVTVMFLQGVLMGSSVVIDKIDIRGVKIPIIYEQSSTLPIVSLKLIVKNAGALRDEDKFGIAKFTASVLSEGTKEKGSIEFANELEAKAVSLDAYAGMETFVFEVSALKEQFDFATKMLQDLLNDPNFTKDNFSKIKQLTLGMLSSKESDFDYVAGLNLKKMMFEKTPIGHSFSGNKRSINSLELDDIQAFYKNYIDLTNMIVVIGGDIDIKTVKESLKELLKNVKIGEKRELVNYKPSEKIENKIIVKDTKQAYIYFGAPFYIKSDSEDIYKSKVASFILGASGFGSRLTEEIRVKRGLAYGAYSRVNINKSTSYFSGDLQTKNESLDEAKKIVVSVIKKFVDKGATQSELNQTKSFLLGSEPLRSETLEQRLSRAFTLYYRGFTTDYSKIELEKIKNLTLEDLNKFIKKHNEINNLSFSIITDAKR